MHLFRVRGRRPHASHRGTAGFLWGGTGEKREGAGPPHPGTALGCGFTPLQRVPFSARALTDPGSRRERSCHSSPASARGQGGFLGGCQSRETGAGFDSSGNQRGSCEQSSGPGCGLRMKGRAEGPPGTSPGWKESQAPEGGRLEGSARPPGTQPILSLPGAGWQFRFIQLCGRSRSVTQRPRDLWPLRRNPGNQRGPLYPGQ